MRKRARVWSDDERQHLELIQAVIARLSSAAARIKGWGLTVALAAFGYAVSQHSPAVAVLGLFATIVFYALDAGYLYQEKLFVELYRAATAGKIDLYSMDKDRFKSSRLRRLSLLSWSVFWFHGSIFTAGVLALTWILSICRQ